MYQIILDENILAKNGTIAIDNTIFKGAAYIKNHPQERFAANGRVLDDFNQYLKQESRLEQVCMLSMHKDGHRHTNKHAHIDRRTHILVIFIFDSHIIHVQMKFNSNSTIIL